MISSKQQPTFEFVPRTTAVLRCNSLGGPNNSFSWRRVENAMDAFDDNDIRGENLTIMNVNANDGGDYLCEVTNAAGMGSDVITITGQLKPL